MKNIVTTLVQQHRGLQQDLGAVAGELGREAPEYRKIDADLKQFSSDLSAHLELENHTFYVELLKKMKEKNQDTQKTEKFIAEMKDIEKVVLAFLQTYSTYSSIMNNIENFKKEFPVIVETLNLRIESEEAGVYAYWGLF